MSLEDITAGNTIANLNYSNPAGDDDVGQGDDHIRNIKKALRYTFPFLSATVSSNPAELNLAHKGGTISGALTVKNNAEFQSTITVSATALFKTGVTVARELNVGGVSRFDSTAAFNGMVTFAGEVVTKGIVSASGAINAMGGINSPVTVSFAYARIDTLVLTQQTPTATASGTVTTTVSIGTSTPSWNAITLLNGYAASASTLDTTPGWYKDSSGRVWMRGRFQIPATYNAIICVMPAEARPLHQIQCFFPQMDVTPGTYMSLAAVDISGTLRVASGNNITGGGQGCLDGMQYMTLS